MPQEYSNEELVEMIRSGMDPAGHMLQLWQQNRGLIGKIAGRYQGYEDIKREYLLPIMPPSGSSRAWRGISKIMVPW